MRRLAMAMWLVAAACNPTGADTSPASGINLVNEFRAEQGLPALATNDALQAKATGWVAAMADAGELSHSTLTDGAPADWLRLGENVGHGATLADVQHALEDSPAHRANLVGPYTHVGVAVLSADGQVWVAQEFAAIGPPPTTATAPPTTTTTAARRTAATVCR